MMLTANSLRRIEFIAASGSTQQIGSIAVYSSCSCKTCKATHEIINEIIGIFAADMAAKAGALRGPGCCRAMGLEGKNETFKSIPTHAHSEERHIIQHGSNGFFQSRLENNGKQSRSPGKSRSHI